MITLGPASPPLANGLINGLLNSDHFHGIFDQLKYNDLSQSSLVSRKWRILVNKYLVNRIVMDAERARVLVAELCPNLPVPKNLRSFLEKDSPFWKGKKNYHTRPLIAFIPSTTLNEFLTWAEMKGLSLDRIYKPILTKYGNSPMRPRWVMMTPPLVLGHKGRPHQTEEILAINTYPDFQAAKLAEATVSIAIQVLLGRDHAYGQPWNYARCELNDNLYLVVGTVTPPTPSSLGGPNLDYYSNVDYSDSGVAALSEL